MVSNIILLDLLYIPCSLQIKYNKGRTYLKKYERKEVRRTVDFHKATFGEWFVIGIVLPLSMELRMRRDDTVQ